MKTCKVCKRRFEPVQSLQATCGLSCALQHGRQKAHKLKVKKKPKKKKLKSIAGLVNDAAAILQRIVRLKAADDNGYVTCVTCGVTRPWQELQGGHFISRVCTAHKLLEENLHPQCPRCNGPLKGNLVNYTLYMVDTYGRDFVDNLTATKSHTKKYNRAEIGQIIADLTAREAEIRELKGL